jgi:ParB/RepB/Spo0J family partition protein
MDDENFENLLKSKNTVDISKINLKNERLKLRNKKVEKDLLSSISENGIQEPLLGFFDKDFFILIDGFKRFRCCKKLHIYNIEIQEIALEEPSAFIKTLKISNSKSMHILEQAKFLKSLKDDHLMLMTDIAISLDKSVTWVSRRITLLKQLTPLQEEKIFNGLFPVWNMMGILHQLQSRKLASPQDIDKFVNATSGKGLVGNDIEILADAYFKGGDEMKGQIENGNLSWAINTFKKFNENSKGLKDDEKRILKDLEITSKYIGRLIFKLPQIKNNDQLLSTAGILIEGILDKLNRFQLTLKTFIREEKK